MWLVGVVVRRYIDFLILLIPTSLVSVLFLQHHPYFSYILAIHLAKIWAIERTRKIASLTIINNNAQ